MNFSHYNENKSSQLALKESHAQQEHLAQVSNDLTAQVEALKLSLSKAEDSHQLQIAQFREKYRAEIEGLKSKSEAKMNFEVATMIMMLKLKN